MGAVRLPPARLSGVTRWQKLLVLSKGKFRAEAEGTADGWEAESCGAGLGARRAARPGTAAARGGQSATDTRGHAPTAVADTLQPELPQTDFALPSYHLYFCNRGASSVLMRFGRSWRKLHDTHTQDISKFQLKPKGSQTHRHHF